MSTAGRGRRLGVDVGSVRIGVASSDPDGILATPVETVPRAKTKRDDSDIRRIVELVAEYEAVEVVVGLPRTLRGEDGKATALVRGFAGVLARRIAPIPVVFADERFSTVVAQNSLRGSGVRARDQRDVIDQAAAVAILQAWLEQPAGHSAQEDSAREVSVQEASVRESTTAHEHEEQQ